jgi:putative ATP-dependent endonuclease of OLD family
VKLETVSIQNYRSIKGLDFSFPSSGILVLVGPNNAGKSNIIRAIDVVCGDGWHSPDKLDDHDYYGRERGRQVSIKLTFDSGAYATWRSGTKWAEYRDDSDNKIFGRAAKDDFPCTYLGADRTFDKHLSFSDWSLLGKIRKQFHKLAQPLGDQLKQKYGELVAVFDQLEQFKQFKQDFARFFDEMQADTAARLSVAFEPFTPANYFRALHILAHDPTQSNVPLDLSELGEGSRNMVLLALLRSYAQNFRSSGLDFSGLLALEEPEIFLHPQARRHLAGILRDIAASGIQVVISTHSASFVDTEYFDSIGRVIKAPDDEAAGRSHTALTLVGKQDLVDHCVATGVPKDKVTDKNIGDFYKTTANPMLNESFFARALVLVEGETEELALPVYLKGLGIDCDLLGISVIRVSGKNQIPKYWRLFGAFEIPIVVMFDSDDDGETSEGKPKEKRLSNKQLAACFGVSVDDLIKDVSICKRLKAARTPGTELIVLENDFENAVRAGFEAAVPGTGRRVDEWDAEARSVIRPIGGQNKGQVARFVARRCREHLPDLLPRFVIELADALKNTGVLPSGVTAGLEEWRKTRSVS